MLLKLSLPPIIGVLLHIVATVLGWYEAVAWLDIPMHFIGGTTIGISAYLFLNYTGLKTIHFNQTVFEILVSLALVALAAMAWEVLEYGLDKSFNTVMQPSIADTMKDLAFGLLGGAVAGLGRVVQKKKPR